MIVLSAKISVDTRAPSLKETTDKLNFIKIKNFYLKDIVKRMKDKPKTGRKYWLNTYLMMDWYLGLRTQL